MTVFREKRISTAIIVKVFSVVKKILLDKMGRIYDTINAKTDEVFLYPNNGNLPVGPSFRPCLSLQQSMIKDGAGGLFGLKQNRSERR